MDERTAQATFDRFLVAKAQVIGLDLAMTEQRPQRIDGGWVFHYQGKAWVEARDHDAMLVGHGPVIVVDDGVIVEGGSLDHDPVALLRRRGIGS
jgi:Immunity protein 35